VAAIAALVASIIGLVLRLTGSGTGHAADPWVWAFLGLGLLALHFVSPYAPWRRP
jgi:hypothetical protein